MELSIERHVHNGEGRSLKRIAIIRPCYSSRSEAGIEPEVSSLLNSVVTDRSVVKVLVFLLAPQLGAFPDIPELTSANGTESVVYACFTIVYVPC